MDQSAMIRILQGCIRELELGHGVLWDYVDAMDVDPPIVDLTDSDKETTNISSGGSGLSSGSDSDNSDLYDDGRQTFLFVPIIDVDEDPTENVELIPICGPFLAMLPGPSVLRSLILIEEDCGEGPLDVRFVPPCLHGNEEARLDVKVKEEESKGKVAGTLEFWAGGYE
jgi:hypothetical protein